MHLRHVLPGAVAECAHPFVDLAGAVVGYIESADAVALVEPVELLLTGAVVVDECSGAVAAVAVAFTEPVEGAGVVGVLALPVSAVGADAGIAAFVWVGCACDGVVVAVEPEQGSHDDLT